MALGELGSFLLDFHLCVYYGVSLIFNWAGRLGRNMSADFWAGYISGAIGIIVGNPLDIVKVKLQAGSVDTRPAASHQSSPRATVSLLRGITLLLRQTMIKI